MSKECLFKIILLHAKQTAMLVTVTYLNNEWFLLGRQVRFEDICCIKHWQKAHWLNILLIYTSKNHIQRHLKRTKKDSAKTPLVRTKISRQPSHWNKQYLFCGKECLIEVDKKNPQCLPLSEHLIGVKESCPSRRWFCRWEMLSPECLYYDSILSKNKKGCFFL